MRLHFFPIANKKIWYIKLKFFNKWMGALQLIRIIEISLGPYQKCLNFLFLKKFLMVREGQNQRLAHIKTLQTKLWPLNDPKPSFYYEHRCLEWVLEMIFLFPWVQLCLILCKKKIFFRPICPLSTQPHQNYRHQKTKQHVFWMFQLVFKTYSRNTRPLHLQAVWCVSKCSCVTRFIRLFVYLVIVLVILLLQQHWLYLI